MSGINIFHKNGWKMMHANKRKMMKDSTQPGEDGKP
jgi:hypothetical protein